MTSPLTIRVFGASMHCYDHKTNSDKFYRAYIWQDPRSGRWYLTKCWGRDGSRGRAKTESCASQAIAERELRMVRAHQMSPRKGYQFLGEGAVHVNEFDVLDNPQAVGQKLHDWVGRPPLKLPDGFVFVIHEEDDIMDLIA